MAVDSNGNLTAELRYKAWGETRYTNGSTPTTYKYTGQKQEATLGGAEGLYFYNARWYDPALGRFIQPDIIVPGPGNPTAWDRYAYAYDNPIIFIDPTGHLGSQPRTMDQCGPDGIYCPDGIVETEPDISYYLDVIQKDFGISISDKFNLEEVKIITISLRLMQIGVDRITGGNGKDWIKKNFQGSNIVFDYFNLLGRPFTTGSTIYILENFENNDSEPFWIIHEFGHVFDNRSCNVCGYTGNATWFGGGYGDALMHFMGGTPTKILRFLDSSLYMPPSHMFGSQDIFGYGNNSPADYFANTFAATILMPGNPNIPYQAELWMATVIDLTK